MKRVGLSKRLRFEIFKRDGFKCRYCGSAPTAGGPLHVDHVVAVANGGTDDPENLVTACQQCNLGKSAVPLSEKQHAAALGELDEAKREHAEQIAEYLKVQKDVAAARDEMQKFLNEQWEQRVRTRAGTTAQRFPTLAEEFGVARLLEAFDIAGAKDLNSTDSIRYLHGILRRWRTDPRTTETPSPAPPADPQGVGRERLRCFVEARVRDAVARARIETADPVIQRDHVVRAWVRAVGGGLSYQDRYAGYADDALYLVGFTLHFGDEVRVLIDEDWNAYEQGFFLLDDLIERRLVPWDAEDGEITPESWSAFWQSRLKIKDTIAKWEAIARGEEFA